MLEKPFVQLMSAISLDGKLTLGRGLSSSGLMPFVPAAVSEEHHKGRAAVDAIMVGATTVVIDNPSLTVRGVEGKNPIRVVPDPEGVIPIDSKLFNDEKAQTIVAVTNQSPTFYVNKLKEKGISVISCGSQKFVDLKILLSKLKDLGVTSLMVEGGATLINLFLTQSLVDEINIFLIPVVVGVSSAPSFSESLSSQENNTPIKLSLKGLKELGDCLLLTYTPEY